MARKFTEIKDKEVFQYFVAIEMQRWKHLGKWVSQSQALGVVYSNYARYKAYNTLPNYWRQEEKRKSGHYTRVVN